VRCSWVTFTFNLNFTVATRTTGANFVTRDRYSCERLVRVALKVEVQNERDFVEIIRAQLCGTQ